MKKLKNIRFPFIIYPAKRAAIEFSIIAKQNKKTVIKEVYILRCDTGLFENAVIIEK